MDMKIGTVSLCVLLMLLAGCVALSPVVVVDTGFQLSAGETKPTQPLAAGVYDITVTSDDGLTIATYASMKDVQLVQAHGNGAEYYQDCAALKSIRFHQTCTLRDGAIFTMTNPNVFQTINVNVKITKTR